MNGLTLRINGGGKKSKNSTVSRPLKLSDIKFRKKDSKIVKDFVECATTDEQLKILKTLLNEEENYDEEIIYFFVIVFLQAESKHPLKCFLTRHITKSPTNIQNGFSNTLADEILCSIEKLHNRYEDYIEIVTQLATCIENFPAGSTAIKVVETEVAGYLKNCLKYCVETLSSKKTLSPTEKNEIFNVSHLALRLFLYIVQKISNENVDKLKDHFNETRSLIFELISDDDVPMDTKSVCGILYLSMHLLEHGSESWTNILQPKEPEIQKFLHKEASILSLCSAIATVVPIQKLQTPVIDGESALVILTTKILKIGESSSSESTIVLGVTRTLLQISKGLEKLTSNSIGLKSIDLILVFVWGHLEHYMDSVRHLTAQILACVVKYCTRLKRKGEDQALNKLFAVLLSLDKSRKSYYVSLTSLTNELGAEAVLQKLPNVIQDLMSALNVQAVQASSTTTLETLLQKHTEQTNTQTVNKMWIQPILEYVATNTLESGVLNILENLMSKAVKIDENIINYIIPYIKQCCENSPPRDLKCVLMLLNVTRKSGKVGKLGSDCAGTEWKGIIGYEVLKLAAVDAVDETRILSLSLIVESPKTTEIFTKSDLDFVIYYLKYNINAQSPNFRQLMLSLLKKFVKRIEESYKVLKKQNGTEHEYYLQYFEELRKLCFASLIQGANYSRRVVALQTLLWCEQICLDSYERIWEVDYVEKLLKHLEDSYENNKSFALEILEKCPKKLLTDKMYSTSLYITDITEEMSSIKPTDYISAAYKLNLLKNKLPEYVVQPGYGETSDPITYSLMQRLLTCLRYELGVCQRSIVFGSVNAPMYGILHGMVHLIARVDAAAISNDTPWSVIISEVIQTCVQVNAAVASVVNNSSPEGHLPMDMTGVVASDHGNSGGVRLPDGRQATAQMVLLCAWRSVKEVSLLLGEISSRLTVKDEGSPSGTLTHNQLVLIGEHFTKLLAETKHRGAFEQAYVGFTKLLARLWRCRSPSLHGLPQQWLIELMAAIESGDRQGTLCATRRSAGLPFMIQALVTTELQVQGNPKCFHQCMSTLLRLARSNGVTDREIETRTHSINILRALFRNAALDESVAPYTGEGLMVALQGFEGSTWMERNSSTLLFSALMVRVFGVQRSRDSDALCIRNRMTGRIFFLRYPMLYDYMLKKLQEVSASDDSTVLRPSLYPILLLLARLYPSTLEGTVSNLRLVAFVPHVLSCAKSNVLKTRQLAAKAMVPLISPEQYISHFESMLKIICDQNIKRNYCHGILLQLIRLIDAKPETLNIDDGTIRQLQSYLADTLWIVEQANSIRPCYLLADEYVKVINMIILRFPTLLNTEFIERLESNLKNLLFSDPPIVTSGRDVCLANALYLHLIVLNKYSTIENICQFILKSLGHRSYEVVITTLNCILILHNKKFEIENKLQENLKTVSKSEVLDKLRNDGNYLCLLCNVLNSNEYLECTQKTLKILALENSTQKYIVQSKIKENCELTDDLIIKTLLDCIRNEHENLTSVYLESLSNFVSEKIDDCSINGPMILVVVREIYEYSSSNNSEDTRSVVVNFLERDLDKLLMYNVEGLSDQEIFEYRATIYATTIRLLEDDDTNLRQRTSSIVAKLSQISYEVISSKSAEMLRGYIADERDSVAILCVMALLDFKTEVCASEDVSEECRVFDQNERYNIFLEETVWTSECADKITDLLKTTDDVKVKDYVKKVIIDPLYRQTFEKLCNYNLVLFEEELKDKRKRKINNKELMNPKIKIFVDKIEQTIKNLNF